MTIAHPSGSCVLSVRADGYKPLERPLTAASAGIAYLQRLPIITGTVTDATTRTPISGAHIFYGSGDPATTDDAGRFRAVIDGAWPARLRVESPGRANRSVAVPKMTADVDMPIAMSRGGAIAVTLEAPLGREALRWDLRRVVDSGEGEKVRSGEVAAGETSISIDALESGAYELLLIGDGPLQRRAIGVTVTDGTAAETTVTIYPARLDLEVVRSGAPVDHADVEVTYRGEDGTMWRSRLATDGEGKSAEELWQPGEYVASIGSWVSEPKTLDARDAISWKIDIPDRIVRGRLTDAGTGQAVPNAIVLLESVGNDGDSSRSVGRTGTDGTYEFKSVDAGSYSLKVKANGYQDFQTPRAPLAEETHLEVRDLRIAAITGQTLRVTNAVGAPLGESLVFVSTRNGTRVAGITDSEGRVVLPLATDESGEVFVLPRSGSFAVKSFASLAEGGEDQLFVTVPDGTTSLELMAQSTDGAPLGGLAYLVRFNGVSIPLEVKEAMGRYQGVPLTSDASGRALLERIPPGRYEIWALASRDDLLAFASPAPPPAAVNVMLTPGHHVAKLTFKPRGAA